MTDAERFAEARPRLLRLAYSELGDLGEAEDVVQEAWLRLERVDAQAIENLDGWLTTVVARLALDRLRSARARRETYVGPWLPEPLGVRRPGGPRHARRVGQLRAADRARAALARGAHGVRAARRVRRAVRRGRRGGRPHAGGGPPARVARPPPRDQRGPALRGVERRARSRRARVRAGDRRGRARGPRRGARPGCRLDVGRWRHRERRAQAAARRRAGRSRVGGARPQVPARADRDQAQRASSG